MTSQIRSRVEYLMPTDNIVVFFHTQIWLQKLALLTGFQYALMIIQKWLNSFILGNPVYSVIHLYSPQYNTIQYKYKTWFGNGVWGLDRDQWTTANSWTNFRGVWNPWPPYRYSYDHSQLKYYKVTNKTAQLLLTIKQ